MTVHPDPLHARIAALEAELREAEAANAAKDEFIAALSRELSNPLAPVLLAVERVRAVIDAGDTARTETALRLLERAISAFDRRTRVLLGLADMKAGMTAPQPSPVDISALVRAAADRHEEVARRASCAFSVEAAPGLLAMAHEDTLEQVLDYLLANAFRFGAGRPVHIRAQPDGTAGVTISVIDQGPGLTADEARRAFALFHRPRGPLEPGLGVELWVAAQLVGAIGGRIWVHSEPGHGAHFHVTLNSSASVANYLRVRDEPAG